MDDLEKARLTELLQRQKRRSHAPAILAAWRRNRVSATLLSDDRQKHLVSWLRANWHNRRQVAEGIQTHLSAKLNAEDFLIVANFWDWEEAVAVLVPTSSLQRIEDKLREFYPSGFLIADQSLCSAIIVDFDDHVEAAEVSVIN